MNFRENDCRKRHRKIINAITVIINYTDFLITGIFTSDLRMFGIVKKYTETDLLTEKNEKYKSKKLYDEPVMQHEGSKVEIRF
jgi:hypothetical protein